jgi:hypothetical protein
LHVFFALSNTTAPVGSTTVSTEIELGTSRITVTH